MTVASNNILIVDDDANLGDGLCEVLELEGFNCARAGTALDAIKQLMQLKPALVLTDLQLPDSDGFKLSQNVKKLCPGTVVIMMTGRSLTTAERENGLKMGTDDYLTKPFDLSQLSVRIRQILAKKEAK
jgi:DNA-binding response OmpR family regulator